jgi:peptide methionine sulfoxide reductase MsrA
MKEVKKMTDKLEQAVLASGCFWGHAEFDPQKLTALSGAGSGTWVAMSGYSVPM